jgi:hypothetical protein
VVSVTVPYGHIHGFLDRIVLHNIFKTSCLQKCLETTANFSEQTVFNALLERMKEGFEPLTLSFEIRVYMIVTFSVP